MCPRGRDTFNLRKSPHLWTMIFIQYCKKKISEMLNLILKSIFKLFGNGFIELNLSGVVYRYGAG